MEENNNITTTIQLNAEETNTFSESTDSTQDSETALVPLDNELLISGTLIPHEITEKLSGIAEKSKKERANAISKIQDSYWKCVSFKLDQLSNAFVVPHNSRSMHLRLEYLEFSKDQGEFHFSFHLVFMDKNDVPLRDCFCEHKLWMPSYDGEFLVDNKSIKRNWLSADPHPSPSLDLDRTAIKFRNRPDIGVIQLSECFPVTRFPI